MNNYNQNTSRRAKVKKQKSNQRKAIFVVSLCLAVILFLVFFFIMKADIALYNSDSTHTDIYFVGVDKKEAVKIPSENCIVRNDSYLFDIDYIAQLLGFTVSGDDIEKTLSPMLSDNSYEFATFNAGSETINVGRVKHQLSEKVIIDNAKMYVPAEFFIEFIDGFSFGYNEDTNRLEAVVSKQDEKAYIGLKLDLSDISAKVNVIGEETDTQADIKQQYTIDMTEYKQYIDPKNAEEYLILINTQNPLDKDFVPHDLIDVVFTRNDRKMQQMRTYAAKSLEALLKEASAHGFDDITVTSGYRDYDYQSYLFEQEIDVFRPTMGDAAVQEAEKHVARPGTSEHQSGLCVDMHNLKAANQMFANTEAYKWLYANCAKFGFILRYPNGKEDITGFIFEPWHFRYVGKTHATNIMSKGLCLEEYLDLIAQQEKEKLEKETEKQKENDKDKENQN